MTFAGGGHMDMFNLSRYLSFPRQIRKKTKSEESHKPLEAACLFPKLSCAKTFVY